MLLYDPGNQSSLRLVRAVGRNAGPIMLEYFAVWVIIIIMTIFITFHRTLGERRAPKETVSRGCRYRCKGINRALGWCAPWGGKPVLSCCGLF